MPILWALADAKIGEREVVEAMLDHEPSSCCAPSAVTSNPGPAKPYSNRSDS